VNSDFSFLSPTPFFVLYIIAALTPIRTYRTVHTIGNSIDGGESGGVFTSLYMSILFRVKKAERPPVAREIKIETIYGFIFDITNLP
jgi:hypothetical protein